MEMLTDLSAAGEVSVTTDALHLKPGTALDQAQRLSRSAIWQLQRRVFEQRGIELWREGTVPHYITSNAFIADAYARLVLGFIRDCRGVGDRGTQGTVEPLDPEQPVYIVELGCGHGRFAYHFLTRFRAMHRDSVAREVSFRYVMSDLSERNIEFWQSHPSLKPFVQEGLLDFARFDPEHESELRQIHCGRTLSPGTVRNPLVWIANYFFDGIPMDAFYINGGKLHESLVKISTSEEERDTRDPEILSRMTVSYQHVPADVDYYDDGGWNRILRDYSEHLTDTAFLFPTGALECVRNLARLSGGRMLLLTADRGACRREELEGGGEPQMAVHGSVSFPVNYHAIGEHVVHQGGKVLQPAHRHASLAVCAYLFGDSPGDHTETRQAYEEVVNAFGPDDFFTLKKAIQETCEYYDIDQLLAFLRLSRWDAGILIACFSGLMRCVPDATEAQKREVYSAVRNVWSTYYTVGESTDVAFNLGTLLCQMDYYPEALGFLEESVRLYGHAPGTDYNMALCYDCLCETEKALACLERALEQDPDYEAAKALRAVILTSPRQKGDEPAPERQ